jgi:hypothetical protein
MPTIAPTMILVPNTNSPFPDLATVTVAPEEPLVAADPAAEPDWEPEPLGEEAAVLDVAEVVAVCRYIIS